MSSKSILRIIDRLTTARLPIRAATALLFATAGALAAPSAESPAADARLAASPSSRASSLEQSQTEAATCVAFSAFQPTETSIGDRNSVLFPQATTDYGGAWNGATFTVPAGGLYYFSLDFVRDSFVAPAGTWDDVQLYLLVDDQDVGYAWAGESDSTDPAAKRMTGAYSTVLQLHEGQVVRVECGSDGGQARHLRNVHFSGARVSSSSSSSSVGFSAFEPTETSNGDRNLVQFPETPTPDAAWNGSTFTAPAPGLYLFSLGFVRDSYLAPVGTWDDVYLFLVRGGIDVGYAWAGESDSLDPDARRMTGAYSVVLELAAGEVLRVECGSDGGQPRHLRNVYFSGVRISSSSGVGFSAFEPTETSNSDRNPVHFPVTQTPHSAWNGSTFTAPAPGLYLFTLGFVRDSYLAPTGTWDDVYLYLMRSNADVGYAWAGESDSTDPAAKRMTGAYSVVLDLLQNELVRVECGSDGGQSRQLLNVYFSGALLSSCDQPQSTGFAYCFGDGTTATPCPCANVGSPGAGCNNSSASGGAILSATGTASLGVDSVVFTQVNEIGTALSIVLQGTVNLPNGVVFGDGVRCAGGTLKRLYTKSATAGMVTAPAASDLSVSAKSASLNDPILPGQHRYYCVYYRDANASFCPNPPGNTWNVGNGYDLLWTN
jgi:hypothetical protein